MMKQRILVIDDERDLCEILQFNLTAAGYQADVAHSAQEAIEKDVSQYDLLLLDVMMPGMSGFELASRLKHNTSTAGIPVIFLTALGDESDKLHGFDLGADDYIAKPFSVREVLARVKAVLARTTITAADSDASLLSYEGLVMDLGKMTVTVDGQPVSLTRTEFDLLHLLLGHRGKVFSRQDVLDRVWPRDVVVTDRTVDVNITRMRKKIGRYSSCIITRHGFGYLFVV
ncbi:MAG: response regulator transcription factor [Muribaculaceae bacterium]|nr:response regulator transcription factor [Muribaculaceae bacterium]